jgi:hypothetical protein
MSRTSQIVQKLWNYYNVLPASLRSAQSNLPACRAVLGAGGYDDLSACDAQADGMSYLLARCPKAGGVYPSARLRTGVEQLTYLLFLKMADERTKP